MKKLSEIGVKIVPELDNSALNKVGKDIGVSFGDLAKEIKKSGGSVAKSLDDMFGDVISSLNEIDFADRMKEALVQLKKVHAEYNSLKNSMNSSDKQRLQHEYRNIISSPELKSFAFPTKGIDYLTDAKLSSAISDADNWYKPIAQLNYESAIEKQKALKDISASQVSVEKTISEEKIEQSAKEEEILETKEKIVEEEKKQNKETEKTTKSYADDKRLLSDALDELKRINKEKLNASREYISAKDEEKLIDDKTSASEKKRISERVASARATLSNLEKQEIIHKKLVKTLGDQVNSHRKINNQIVESFKNAMTMQKIFDRIAFVITARLSYQAFDFISSSLRDGWQNAVKLEAHLERIAQISKLQPQKYIEESIKESLRLGLSLDDVTKSAYDSVSAQFSTAETQKLMAITSKMAVVGFTEQSEAMDALTSILNSYKMDISEASKVSDILFKVIELGKTTLKEIAPDIGKLSATASLLGVSFEEVSAGIATMTLNGIKTNVAMTAMNQLFLNLTKPTREAKEIFDKYNISIDIAQIRTKGLAGMVKELNMLTDEEIATIASSNRGFRALATAISSGAEWTENYNKILGSTGITQTAFNAQMETADMQLKKMKGEFQAIGISVWQGFLPAINIAGEAVSTLLKGFQGLYGQILLVVGTLPVLYKSLTALATLSKANLWIAGITIGLTAIAGVIGSISKRTEEFNQAMKDYSEQRISEYSKEREELSKNNELLRTYISLKERETKGEKLSRDEKALLLSSHEALTSTYRQSYSTIDGYVERLQKNIDKQNELTGAIRKTNVEQARIFLYETKKKEEGFLSNTISKERSYITEGSLKDKSFFGKVLSLMSESPFASALDEGSYEKFVDEIWTPQFKDMSDRIIRMTERVGENDADSARRVLDEIVKLTEFDNQAIASLTKSMSIATQNKDSSAYEIYKIRLNDYKERTKSSKNILSASKAYLEAIVAETKVDDEIIKAGKGEGGKTGGGKGKEPTFDRNRWETAKAGYKNQSEIYKELSKLLSERKIFIDYAKKFYANDVEAYNRIQETAKSDVLYLVSERYKSEIKSAQNAIKSARTVNDIIAGEEGLRKIYKSYMKDISSIGDTSEQVADILEEMNAIFAKIKVEVDIAHKQRQRILEKEKETAELESAMKNISGFSEMWNNFDEMTLKQIEQFIASNSEILSDYQTLNSQLQRRINEREKTNAMILEANAGSKGSFGYGLLKSIGIEGKNQTAEEYRNLSSRSNLSPELQKRRNELKEILLTEEGEAIGTATQDFLNASLDMYQDYLDRRIEQINAERDAKLTAIDTQAKTEYRSSLWIEAEKLKVEKEAEKERKKINRDKKRSMIAEAVANQALGIVKIWGNKGYSPITAGILTALLLATTGVQIDMLSKQKFEKGGIVQGKRHSQGGVPIEVEGNEMIFSRKATMGNESLLLALNSALEGRNANSLTVSGNRNVSVPNSSSSSSVQNLEKQFEGLQKSIENIQMNVVLQGEFLSDIKLSKKVENGNRKRSII